MGKTTCTQADCERQVFARDWCQTHYKRWRQTGDPGGSIILGRIPPGSECRVDGCDRPAKCRGMCKSHYGRWRTTGDAGDGPVVQERRCSVDDCVKKHYGQGFCQMHWARQKHHGSTDLPPRQLKAGQRPCSVEGCDRKYDAKGYCRAHYRRWKEHGDPGPADFSRPSKMAKRCSLDGCDFEYYGRGYCKVHYRRWKSDGDPGPADVVVKIKTTDRDAMGRKMCSGCREWVDVNHFTIARHTGDGLNYRCRRCYRHERLLQRYSITIDRFEEMLAAQGGVCAICRQPPRAPSRRSFYVDHDHKCCPGETACGDCVRGLLCVNCNSGIGNLMDDPDRLESALRYLREWAGVLV